VAAEFRKGLLVTDAVRVPSHRDPPHTRWQQGQAFWLCIEARNNLAGDSRASAEANCTELSRMLVPRVNNWQRLASGGGRECPVTLN
jgi:hypothetical protein